MSLPDRGSVLGIDIGFSPGRRSSAVCRLDWTSDSVDWTIARFRYDAAERRRVIAGTAGPGELATVAIDGPLGPGLVAPTRYRMAEKMLTSGFGPLIGKPGACNAPIGLRLAVAACEAARVTLEVGHIASVADRSRLHERSIIEAFPSAFLGMLLADPAQVPARRGNRSDVFYEALAVDGALAGLVRHLLPGRVTADLAAVRHHDDRAAVICALTALAFAAGDCVTAGDLVDGWITLPPAALIQPWARELLAVNAARFGGEVRGL